MKRIFVLAVLPVMLFALERVNLIKDAGFEKDNGSWNSYVGRSPKKEPIPGIALSHDSEKAYSGMFSGSCDTRLEPAGSEVADAESTVVIQGFCVTKHVTDLDSFFLYYSIRPAGDDFSKTYVAPLAFYLDANSTTYWIAEYDLKASDLTLSAPPKHRIMQQINFPTDTLWYSFTKNIRKDLEQLGGSSSTTVDSLIVFAWGLNRPPWRGQKIYFDDIRLTGYADYDVGVKELLSGDSVWKNTGYIPTARVKNFGRKAADSFLVIATIEGGSGVVYADTLTWSLAADTEDTLSFKEFKPSDAANYTLTVSTLMTPDESDEDDAVSRTLFGTAVAEPVLSPQSLSLQIEGVLRAGLSSIRYSLHLGEQGTISLYDPSGRRIESLKVTGSGSINLKSSLSSGVYFVKLETGKASITRKFAVLH